MRSPRGEGGVQAGVRRHRHAAQGARHLLQSGCAAGDKRDGRALNRQSARDGEADAAAAAGDDRAAPGQFEVHERGSPSPQGPAHDLQHDLVRSSVTPIHARISIRARDRVLEHVAVAAVKPQAGVDDPAL